MNRFDSPALPSRTEMNSEGGFASMCDISQSWHTYLSCLETVINDIA